MPGLLDSCEEHFGTRDLYKILEIPKKSLEKDVKKAYYKISLKVHPDRVPEEEKALSTEKFKVLSKVHQILTDKKKKELYDEQGVIEDEDDEGSLSTWLELWQKIFKPITTEDIDNFKNDYVGSELERADIKKAYINGKGCINYMFQCVPFIQVEDEPRLIEIVKEMIKADEIPEYEICTKEPAAKRKRRHKKYAKEKIEAEEMKKDDSLHQQIMQRQQERASDFGSLLDALVEKYGDDDDEDVVDFDDVPKKKKRKVVKNPKKGTPKTKERLVRNGRVQKKKTT